MYKNDPRKARMGVEILPFEVGYLPTYYQKKAEVEIEENCETRPAFIKELKDMIAANGDKHIKKIVFCDDFLLSLLRTRKYNLDKTYKQLVSFVNLTLKNPEMFTNFNFEKTLKTIKDDLCFMLPYRCQEGCAILYVQLGNWDVDSFPMEEVKRMLVVTLMQAARDPMTQVNGIKAIIDVKPGKYGWSYLKECISFWNLFLLYHATQKCLPGRYKEIHVVNYEKPFMAVWLIVRQFLPVKLRNRIFFHISQNNDEIFDFFPRAIVPSQYDGDLTEYDQTEWLKKMMSPEMLGTMGGGALNPI